MSQAARAHLKAAGRRSFKMQAPGWTFAILPLALSMLASDTGSSAGAQPSIQQEEIGIGGGGGEGVGGGREDGWGVSRISTLPLDTWNKGVVGMISGKRKWKVNLPFMVRTPPRVGRI